MNNLHTAIKNYLEFCKEQKRLDPKTIKAYKIDLRQFETQISLTDAAAVTPQLLEEHISTLHEIYKPKTVKRKIATLKAFFHYLEFKDYITLNPFNKIQVKFREPIILPKTIPLHIIEQFMSVIYHQKENASTEYRRKCAVRDIAIIELLFATGMRISELCSLHPEDVDLQDGTILIYGKGAKERRILIGNKDVIRALNEYHHHFYQQIHNNQYFFINQQQHRLSEQSVREMINKYVAQASIAMHITPHMFRHSFATYLLEADVDIRYIQEMLGHSSINVTEIYTHVAMAKQRVILATKHPRKDFQI